METVLYSDGFRILNAWILLVFVYFALNGFMQYAAFRGGFRSSRSLRQGSKRIALIGRKLMRVSSSEAKYGEMRQLLQGCGWQMDVRNYYLVKRLCWICLMLLAALAMWLRLHPDRSSLLPASLWVVALSAAALALLADRYILHAVVKQRSRAVMKEVHAVSKQLLYYAGSTMNIHAKLTLCVPLTTKIRKEFELLLNEWYQDAEQAVDRFKQRLGTDEGYSFAETIQALRLYESEQYYELLRQRIRDYKEKLELLKESRKETFSYVLFVLAGLPILNTFRVFIYPWVAEGQKLFDLLN